MACVSTPFELRCEGVKLGSTTVVGVGGGYLGRYCCENEYCRVIISKGQVNNIWGKNSWFGHRFDHLEYVQYLGRGWLGRIRCVTLEPAQESRVVAARLAGCTEFRELLVYAVAQQDA